jgi:16S rRNA processing protein RimM
MTLSKKSSLICVGQFVGAHGVKGLAKIRSYTEDPLDIFSYIPLLSDDGDQTFKLKMKSAVKENFIVEVDGIKSKEEADALRGDKIFVTRTTLPKTKKNQFYEADLLGLRVTNKAGKDYGQVLDVHDHGAGVFIEIGTSRKNSFMLPFKDAFVPEVNLSEEYLLIEVPDGWV